MVALFACLEAASICGQEPRSFPGSTQEKLGSKIIQVTQTPLWLGGEQEFKCFRRLSKQACGTVSARGPHIFSHATQQTAVLVAPVPYIAERDGIGLFRPKIFTT